MKKFTHWRNRYYNDGIKKIEVKASLIDGQPWFKYKDLYKSLFGNPRKDFRLNLKRLCKNAMMTRAHKNSSVLDPVPETITRKMASLIAISLDDVLGLINESHIPDHTKTSIKEWIENDIIPSMHNEYDVVTELNGGEIGTKRVPSVELERFLSVVKEYSVPGFGTIKTFIADKKAWYSLKSIASALDDDMDKRRAFLREASFNVQEIDKIRITVRDEKEKFSKSIMFISENGIRPLLEKSSSLRAGDFMCAINSSVIPCLRKEINKNLNKDRPIKEGKLRQVTLTQRERNPKNRAACLAIYGYSCQICGFDFERFYGELGRGYIHVHHIEMISSYEEEKEIDPAKDLLPVCPNCHAMLHKEEPPMHPSILKRIIAAKAEVV